MWFVAWTIDMKIVQLCDNRELRSQFLNCAVHSWVELKA
jgi:hypothetical protein